MDKIIIRDLTLSSQLKEKEAKEAGLGEEQVVKAPRYWENRMTPPEKVDYLVKNFNRFLAFNPEYVQEGPIQIAVSATKDTGAYQIKADEYIDNLLISKEPMRGLRYFVATLDEARSCASAHRRYYRCLYSRTYYVSKDENGDIHMELLLQNDDWLYMDRIDYAFKEYVDKKKGNLLGDTSQWCAIKIQGVVDYACVRYYEDAEKAKRCLLCLVNSGTIIDEEEGCIFVDKTLEYKGLAVDVANQFLRFRMMNGNEMLRVNSNNPVFNYSLHS